MAITGIVITYNEERRLEACLKSLEFCSQLIVVDIGSTDRSLEIAKSCGAEILQRDWAPAVEQIWPNIIPNAKHEWIIRLDPDEIVPKELASDIAKATSSHDKTIGMISLPHQYYFREKPLDTTIWGGINYIPRIIHRERIVFTDKIHGGHKCKPSYRIFEIPYNSNALKHYWVDTYQQLWEKHWRYIKLEGKSRYDDGQRFKLYYLAQETVRALYIGLILRNGWRGGFTGIFLSFFYAWYVFMSLLSLKLYETHQTINGKEKKHGKQNQGHT